MDKKLLTNDYLQGRHPIEDNSWELPTEGELDRDEALYDALLRPSKSPLKGDLSSSPSRGGREGSWRRWSGWLLAVAAVLVAVFTLFTWKNQTQEPQPPTHGKTAENVVPKDMAQAPEKHTVLRSPTHRAAMANAPCRDRQRTVPRLQEPRIARKSPISQNTLNTPITQNTQEPSTTEPQLLNAADSLYYYLTLLENQMGDCRDSSCLAELTGLMRADERIKDLVNKIINKQVETAYKEEYLVDTTTRYIPL